VGRGDLLVGVVVLVVVVGVGVGVVVVVAPGPAMATDPIAAIFLSGFHLTTSP
jgi:hypothetical protein